MLVNICFLFWNHWKRVHYTMYLLRVFYFKFAVASDQNEVETEVEMYLFCM